MLAKLEISVCVREKCDHEIRTITEMIAKNESIIQILTRTNQ